MKFLLGGLILLALAYLLGLDALAYAMIVILTAWGLSWLTTKWWTENVTCVRTLSAHEATAGQTITVTLTVTNAGAVPVLWVLVEETLPEEALTSAPPALRLTGGAAQVLFLWGRQTKRILYDLHCPARGYHQIGPTLLETGDFFGFFRRFQLAGQPDYLIVLPEVTPLEGYGIASRRPVGEVRMTHRLFEDPTRIAGVRAYQIGDALSRIHWRASARTGELHSKVYEPSSVAGATILLDFHEAVLGGPDRAYRRELAVTAAVSIAYELERTNKPVGLIANGRDAADRVQAEGIRHTARSRLAIQAAITPPVDRERLRPILVPTRRGGDQFFQIRLALARLEVMAGLPLDAMITEAAGRITRNATMIAIISGLDEPQRTALTSLVRQGFAVLAVLNMASEAESLDAAAALAGLSIESRVLRNEADLPGLVAEVMLR